MPFMVNNSVTAEDIKSRAFEGMNEETVCARLVVPYLTDILGWDIRDVHAEYRVHESNWKKVDYALPNEEEPSLLVEVKSLGTNLQNEIDQLSEYLILSNVDYGLLTDGIKCILIERSDEGSTSVNSQFEIVDEPSDPVLCNNSEERKSRNSMDFFQDISESAPPQFPNRLMKPICIQYESRRDKIEPIHMCLCMDMEMSSGIREFFLNQYEEIVYLRDNGRSKDLLENSSDPNIVVFDNIESNQDVTGDSISKAFDSIIIDEATRLPKYKPLIIIDAPETNRLNAFDPISEQVRVEEPILNDIDLIYTLNNTQTQENGAVLSQRYFDGYEWDPSKIELEIVSEDTDHAEIKEEAREYISEFFVSILREEEGMIPISPRLIGTLSKITVSAATIESSEEATKQHAEYAKDIVMGSLRDIRYDAEENRFDVDMTEMNQSTNQPDRRDMLLKVIDEAQDEGDKGAPRELIVEVMVEKYGFDKDEVEYDLRKLSRESEDVYEPKNGEFGMF